MFQDISIKKNNEIELEKTKQKLESILNEINDVVWSVALPDYKLLFISPSALNLYGYSYEEWEENIGLWEEMVYEEDKDKLDLINKLLTEKGEYKNITYRIITKSGELK